MTPDRPRGRRGPVVVDAEANRGEPGKSRFCGHSAALPDRLKGKATSLGRWPLSVY
jgi:hypothetical protein